MHSTSHAFVTTDTPARYISRLCKHFAHKIPVSFDETQGHIEFSIGSAELAAESNGLRLIAPAQSPEVRPELEQVMARHFERFAWQEALTLEWQAV
jgi:hypothetical protein